MASRFIATDSDRVTAAVIPVPLFAGIANSSDPLTLDVVLSGSGSKARLNTPTVNNTSATYRHGFFVRLPVTFISGSEITVNVTGFVDVAPTVSKTLDLEAWKTASDGTVVGSDLVSTSAQAITTSAAVYSFTVDGSGLVAGDILLLNVAFALDDTGGSGAKKGLLTKVEATTALRFGM